MNLGVKGKVLSIVIVASFVSLIIGAFGYYSLLKLDDVNMEAYNAEVFHAKMVEMKLAHVNWRLSLGKFQRDVHSTTIDAVKDPHQCGFGKWYYSDDRKAIEAKFPKMASELKEIEEIHNKYHDSALVVENFLKAGKRADALGFFTIEVPKRLDHALSQFDKIIGTAKAYSKEYDEEAENVMSRSAIWLIVIIVAGAGFVLVSGFLFSTILSKQILSITEQVGDASEQVSSASGQLSASSEELSNSAQGQAAAVEEASASLTEIQGMIEANVKNSEDSHKLTGEVYRYTEETKILMNELSDAMAKILESNVKIEKLAKVIEEVGAKTEVIDDIVFKTQLLSFNASVEAERAGEHGRGFAVVAQEVGNLAQMSGKAAGEISSIVKISIKEADEIARENKERVENGGKLANVANKKMTEVMEKISQIQASTTKVLEASREQSQGINQITTSVESINQTTQETASTSEEAASASEELSGQSEALLGLVNTMRTIVTGNASYDASVEVNKIHSSKSSNNVISLSSKSKRPRPAPKMSPKKAAAAKAYMHNSDDAWEKI